MEKRSVVAASAIFTLMCVAVFAVSAVISSNLRRGLVEEGAVQRIAEALPSAAPAQAESYAYLVREWDGKICVYDREQWESPILITDIDAEGLRQADRELFREGIGVADQEALLRLLEDFSS